MGIRRQNLPYELCTKVPTICSAFSSKFLSLDVGMKSLAHRNSQHQNNEWIFFSKKSTFYSALRTYSFFIFHRSNTKLCSTCNNYKKDGSRFTGAFPHSIKHNFNHKIATGWQRLLMCVNAASQSKRTVGSLLEI